MNIKIISFVVFLFVFTILAVNSYAVECPFGITNDPEPGQCGRYIDENNDGYCDLSEETILFNEKVANNDDNKNTTENKTKYNFLLMTIITVLAYILSIWAVKARKISLVTQRYFWNMLLLISFAVTAITSIILALSFEYGIKLNLPINIFYWHIEIGFFAIITMFLHLSWHLRYYKINKC